MLLRGHELVAVYSENESAWRAGHQHELASLLDDLRSGSRRYDILLMWALDRLSRQGAASILNLVNTFKAYGVKVVSLQESWTELPGELGEVLFAIAGWVARMELQRRSKRTKAGLVRAVADGSKLGRPSGSKDKNGRGDPATCCGTPNKGSVRFMPSGSRPNSLGKQMNDCCGTGNAVIMGLQGRRVTRVLVEES